jgi:hypothetical protein
MHRPSCFRRNAVLGGSVMVDLICRKDDLQKDPTAYDSPMSKRKSPSSYMRFLALCQALDQGYNPNLDLVALRLLEDVALAEFRDQPLTVSQAMGLKQIASPATIHRKLQELLKSGLVELRYTESNRRSKYIRSTKSGTAYFSKRSNLLMQAIQAA